MDLDEFIVTETDRGTGLTCPRRKCGGKMIVNLEAIREARLIVAEATGRPKVVTTSCPYCFKVSLIPPT